MKKYSIEDMAAYCGLGRPTMVYHKARWLPLTEPEWIGMRQFFSEKDMAAVKAYFAARKPYERTSKKEKVAR